MAGTVELTVSARLPLKPRLPTYRPVALSDAKGQYLTCRMERGAADGAIRALKYCGKLVIIGDRPTQMVDA